MVLEIPYTQQQIRFQECSNHFTSLGSALAFTDPFLRCLSCHCQPIITCVLGSNPPPPSFPLPGNQTSFPSGYVQLLFPGSEIISSPRLLRFFLSLFKYSLHRPELPNHLSKRANPHYSLPSCLPLFLFLGLISVYKCFTCLSLDFVHLPPLQCCPQKQYVSVPFPVNLVSLEEGMRSLY